MLFGVFMGRNLVDLQVMLTGRLNELDGAFRLAELREESLAFLDK